MIGAGNEAISLVHGDHHRAEIIWLEHCLARFEFLHAFRAAQSFEAVREIIQFSAFGRIDNPNAFQRNVERLGQFLDFASLAQEDGRAKTQRMELPGGLEHPRLTAFRKDNPFRMPL